MACCWLRRAIKGGGRAATGMLAAITLLIGMSAMPAMAATVAANLACNEGTNLNLSLDVASLQELENSVQAMVLYPAGISCAVTQLPAATAVASSNSAYADSGHELAVGAVQLNELFCLGDINVNLSAHNDTGAPTTSATGHMTENGNGGCTGQVRSDVVCLQVIPPSSPGQAAQANVVGHVTEATGAFLSGGFVEGGYFNFTIYDYPSGAGEPADQLFTNFTTQPTDTMSCAQAANYQPIESGNFVVRSGA